MQRWITDTEPSARFPLSTRANAGEVPFIVDGSSGTITVIELPEG